MKSDAESAAPAPAEFPAAVVRAAGRGVQWRSGWWLVVAAAIVVSLILVVASRRALGPKISVRFEQGFGIHVGDTLRYRGIEVGEVVGVSMSDQLQFVDVQIQLMREAESIAREGSRFWIERPQVSLTRVRGLETVVGPKYVAVIPGPPTGKRQVVFAGQETPLSIDAADATEISIRFREGHGLSVGDPLRHRGIVVGEVTSVELSEGLTGVHVRLRLTTSALSLARTGTQFWIERPRVGFSGVRGLDTLVGRYVAVMPGADSTETQREFEGLENPPVAVERLAGALEIVLESPHRFGVESGDPVVYRGVQVGTILSVGLAPDAASVESRVLIHSEYRQLIRANTEFWSTSGFDVNFGITGLQMSADTLATIAAGGVALATPEPPGEAVVTGARFELKKNAEDEKKFLSWKPRVPVGTALLPEGQALPQPQRAILKWKKRTLGVRRSQERQGWVLVLDNRRLLALAELLVPPEEAVDQTAVLEVAGQQIVMTRETVRVVGELAVCTTTLPDEVQQDIWPARKLRVAAEPEDVLLVRGHDPQPTAIAASRQTKAEGRWPLDAALSVDPDSHGAVLIATQDGLIVGLLRVEKNRRFVLPFTQELVTAATGE